MNFAVQLVIDVKVTDIFEGVATSRTPEALSVEILFTDPAKYSDNQATTFGTCVLSGLRVRCTRWFWGSDWGVHMFQHGVSRESDAGLR
jgi:hypothetical protein